MYSDEIGVRPLCVSRCPSSRQNSKSAILSFPLFRSCANAGADGATPATPRAPKVPRKVRLRILGLQQTIANQPEYPPTPRQTIHPTGLGGMLVLARRQGIRRTSLAPPYVFQRSADGDPRW